MVKGTVQDMVQVTVGGGGHRVTVGGGRLVGTVRDIGARTVAGTSGGTVVVMGVQHGRPDGPWYT